jgi:hypothetical protein
MDELLVITGQIEVLVAPRHGIQTDFENILLLEAGIDGAQALEAANEKTCTEQQHQRKRHLRDDEYLAKGSDPPARAACFAAAQKRGLGASNAKRARARTEAP